MKKKIVLVFISILSIVILSACSGSEAIQGTWNAQDAAGNNSSINFSDKTVTVDGESFEYTQNAVGTKNGTKYYGIKQSGGDFSIIFPEKDKNIAIMIVPNSTDDYLSGTMIYAMNKSESPDYEEYAKKYMK